LAGSPLGGVVLDPFMGSGTTAAVAKQHCRQYLGCELNPEYRTLIEERLK
jgi:DNA modification methylase